MTGAKLLFSEMYCLVDFNEIMVLLGFRASRGGGGGGGGGPPS